jgi:hypothetical protein
MQLDDVRGTADALCAYCGAVAALPAVLDPQGRGYYPACCTRDACLEQMRVCTSAAPASAILFHTTAGES